MAMATSTLTELARVGSISDGAMTEVVVKGREVLLARVKDTYYATEGRCPHMGGKLSLGKLEGTTVTCPRHQSRFDLVDGRVLRWTDWGGVKLALAKLARAPRPLKVYRVKIEGDRIMAEI